VFSPFGRAWRSVGWGLLLAVMLAAGLTACSGDKTADSAFTIATILPMSGADAPLGQAIQRAVDLAVQQNATLGGGHRLTVTHVDEVAGALDQDAATLVADQRVVGIVGPLASESAVTLLPIVGQQSIVTISPGATLPGLTQADQAKAEGLDFAQLHPKGTPAAFFRLPQTDRTAGKVAADLAVATTQAQGLAAHAVFIVDDGSLSGKTLAAAFSQELHARQGTVAGQSSIALTTPDSAQAAVSAIIEANPDLVFFAGGTTTGAELRATLSLTGAPGLVILTAGPIADHPGWASAVGMPAAAANTTALLPAQDLSALSGAKDFVAAYRAAYPGAEPLPQSALAYDAAMDEIAAIKSLIASGKPVTRAAVRAAVATAKYAGITATLAFNANGENTTPISFSLYTCDLKGVWHYQRSLKG
jgi:branched-chain amino acid transport system substrate-binding protein